MTDSMIEAQVAAVMQLMRDIDRERRSERARVAWRTRKAKEAAEKGNENV